MCSEEKPRHERGGCPECRECGVKKEAGLDGDARGSNQETNCVTRLKWREPNVWIELGMMACVLFWTPFAHAQEQLGNFSKPIPILSTGGHSAAVRSLAFSPDGSQLFSAGLDKVVHVWTLNDGRPRLTRTLRPPIWRGMRGAIHAIALSSTPAPGPADPPKPQYLAVAGYGIEAGSGNIFVMNISARDDAATGRVEALLHSGSIADREPVGHTDSVTALAFAPGSLTLASASLDGSARLWDIAAKRTTATFRHPSGSILALAFRPDGRRLVTGGSDGIVRIWDVAQPAALPVEIRADPSLGRINALAYSPDSRWIVVGRENGLLLRIDAATRAVASFSTNRDVQGAVKALAFSSDGSRLAVSLVARRTGIAALPRDDSDVEVRALPDGRVLWRSTVVGELAFALGFHPNGKMLAYAGGSDQAIHLADLTDARRARDDPEGDREHDPRRRVQPRGTRDRLQPRSTRAGSRSRPCLGF